MKEIIYKILNEVDSDIRDLFIEIVHDSTGKYERWEFLKDPCLTAIKWQELRDRKKL